MSMHSSVFRSLHRSLLSLEFANCIHVYVHHHHTRVTRVLVVMKDLTELSLVV